MLTTLGRFCNCSSALVDFVDDAHELLDVAFQRLQGCQCHVLPVLQRGHVVGLLTPDNVGEFIMFRGVVASPLPAAGTVTPS